MSFVRIVRESECTAEKLPSAAVAQKVNDCLRENPMLVVTAPPGAGKSTLLPITILNGLDADGKVLLLEPRRIAARQIAERMAYLIGEQVGKTVGYRVRFEAKVSQQTRIEVLTEGILAKRLVSDPFLEDVSVVIFDELHERSLVSDHALALTRETFRQVRPDLKIVIMSATIDSSALCPALGASLVESAGRSFPVEVFHSDRDSEAASCAEDVARCVLKVHRTYEGDILAFLPGEAEIRRCAGLLGDSLTSSSSRERTVVLPLYGMLSSVDQRRAIAPSRPGERKVVLATPIAETSITIEGVSAVVDSGFCRKMMFNPQSGLNHLETVRISLDMARQRTGRAGRTAPGVCYRLWTEGTERRMAECRTPEILEADLCSTVLEIAAWGGKPMEDLQWLTPPPVQSVRQAVRVLSEIGALDSSGTVTRLGRSVASLPCHPRIARMLLMAGTPERKALASDVAALLEERDPMASEAGGVDIGLRLDALRRARRDGSFGRCWGRIAEISSQYRSMVNAPEDNSPINPFDVGLLIAGAYPERIAQGTGCGRFFLSDGQTAVTDLNDPLSESGYLAVATMNSREGGPGRIFLACVVSPEDVPSLSRKDVLSWDSKAGKVMACSQRRIGRILVDSKPLPDVGREDIVRAICEAAPKEGLSMFDFNDDVRNLQRRVAVAASWHPELELPDLSVEAVLGKAGEWLPLYVGNASSSSELKKIDMQAVLWAMLDYSQQNDVERIAPSHIQVPSGSRIRLEYRNGADLPVLRVRLQECFGMTDTPRVDGGSKPVLMELLSPGYKPVQLTSDLRSFWSTTYFEVRKELRRRYPKHSWPDNPLEADAVRGPLARR
ncbi:MAG: ATP-dependent helicase HrpB [Candidatus Cryptobacteroides sp.]